LRNYPNPFNATTEIRFDVPMRAQVRLTVYDVLGRQVALLADRQFDAGSFALTWNGQDATGRGVASGKYFVRLAAGDELQTRPIVLLK
jgi:flagellar hook assembly protein FlgD